MLISLRLNVTLCCLKREDWLPAAEVACTVGFLTAFSFYPSESRWHRL